MKFGQTNDGVRNASFTANESSTISNENYTLNSSLSMNVVDNLWKKINLLGCITVLQEVYGSRLIHGQGFLAIELGLCVFILIEIAALAIAFAYAMNTPSSEYGIAEQDDEEHF